jgi:anthranilate synthase component 2
MIDNYDSFTYNLVRYFRELGTEVVVYRNDAIRLADIERIAPDHLVISPGPCTPDTAGISMAAIEHFAGKIPVLGVCLGHQSIGQVFGGNVVRAEKVMHGKISQVSHKNLGVFEGLAQPLEVTRYHSLVVESHSLPDCLEATAWCLNDAGDEDVIMGLRHKTLAVEGVQFHPEAVLTHQGHDLLKNFLKRRCEP